MSILHLEDLDLFVLEGQNRLLELVFECLHVDVLSSNVFLHITKDLSDAGVSVGHCRVDLLQNFAVLLLEIMGSGELIGSAHVVDWVAILVSLVAAVLVHWVAILVHLGAKLTMGWTLELVVPACLHYGLVLVKERSAVDLAVLLVTCGYEICIDPVDIECPL